MFDAEQSQPATKTVFPLLVRDQEARVPFDLTQGGQILSPRPFRLEPREIFRRQDLVVTCLGGITEL